MTGKFNGCFRKLEELLKQATTMGNLPTTYQ